MIATSKVKAPVGSTRPGDLVEIEKLAASCSDVQPLPEAMYSVSQTVYMIT